MGRIGLSKARFVRKTVAHKRITTRSSGPSASCAVRRPLSFYVGRNKLMRTALALTTIFMLCGASLAAQSDESQMRCGNTVITATAAKVKGGETYVRNFKITLSNNSGAKAFEYSPENEFLHLSCFRSATSEFLLVNHFCSGSGCSESNYGIVELPSFRVLLTPDDRWKGNASAASALLGVIPLRPNCEAKSPTHLCLHSAQE